MAFPSLSNTAWLRIGKAIETENRLVMLLGNQEKGVTANGYEISSRVIKCSEVG